MRIETLALITAVTAFATACNAPESAAVAAPQGSQPLPQDHPVLEEVVARQERLPQGHPSMDAPSDSWSAAHVAGTAPGSGPPVVVPEGVRGHWAAVRLAVTDSAGNRSEMQAAIGAKVELPGSSLSLRADPYLPSYMSDNSGITSRSNEPDNPAVLVALLEGDQVIEEGWVFRDWPAFNTYSGARVQVELLSADAVEAAGRGEGL